MQMLRMEDQKWVKYKLINAGIYTEIHTLLSIIWAICVYVYLCSYLYICLFFIFLMSSFISSQIYFKNWFLDFQKYLLYLFIIVPLYANSVGGIGGL